MSATMMKLAERAPQTRFLVVHPLDDVPEEKLDTSKLHTMPLTRGAKIALMALRGYLVLMTALVVYHALDLAGLLRHFGH